MSTRVSANRPWVDDVAAADLDGEGAGDGHLDDDLGAGVLAEEAAAAARGDDRDPVAEVADVELLGALAGDPDGRSGWCRWR